MHHWLISATTPEKDAVDMLISAPSRERALKLWEQTLIERDIPPKWGYMVLLPDRVVRLPPVSDTERVHSWSEDAAP